jgi:hypothetical protein
LLPLFGQANKGRRLTGRNPSVLIFKRIISEGERLIIRYPVPLSPGIQKQSRNLGFLSASLVVDTAKIILFFSFFFIGHTARAGLLTQGRIPMTACS